MAGSSIASAAQWLGKLMVQEVQFLAGVRGKVEELQSELEWMQCFLLDADEQQTKNAIVRKWVSDIRDLALESEDLVEKYILGVSHKRQVVAKDAWWKRLYRDLKWIANLSCFWDDTLKQHGVGCAIDGLTLKISKLSLRLQTYGIKISEEKSGSSKSTRSKIRQAYSHEVDEDVVGLDEGVQNMGVKLVEDDWKIVMLHGMGGIGKTTFAREVYHHKPLKDHFDGTAWAYISQEFQVETVCKDILLQLIPEWDDEERKIIQDLPVSQLPTKLFDVLKEGDYLVVLDDVWSATDWSRLEPAFPLHDEVNSGSKILLTTRNPQILSHLGKDIVCDVETLVLDRDRSWELLKKKAHLSEDLDPKMMELGNKMLDHCKGHPLAIMALGGVLAAKNKIEEWESVYENHHFLLHGDELYGGVYEVLAMSYYDLPYNIKPCFLQLANFPEDFEIPREKLYDLWIAEGLISLTHDQFVGKRSLEDVADVYMNELVQKGMVQAGSKDAEGIRTYRMHDLMRDMCMELAEQEFFLKIVDCKARADEPHEASSNSVDERIRRLAIYVDGKACHSLPDSSSRKALPLRSILFFPIGEHKEENCEWIKKVCKDFQLLRILDFEGLCLKGSLPDEIGSLIFLRYLSLKDTQITELPSPISNLRSLLILDLRVSHAVIKLPNVLWKINSLRHLYLPSKMLTQESDHLYSQGYEIEGGHEMTLDTLSYLEKLEDVDLDRVNVKGLLELKRMRKLSALCVSKKETLSPFLKSSSIKKLCLKIDARLLHEDPMLLSDCRSLKSLDIESERSSRGNIHYLPIKLETFPRNLVNLAFWYIILPEDPMPVLEKLPKLRNLALRICYGGSKLVCTDKGFPELRNLTLDGLFNLEEWEVENGGLPKLSNVEIWNSQIIKLPDALPEQVAVHCKPCVPGTEKHGTCCFLKNGVIRS